jgi:hypothetical protein
VAEEAIIARDCLLAAHVGSALHICHVSTAGSVEIIRWAKSKGWPVTAEVTPHHLLLTDKFAAGYDPVFKVNPPLRTAADVAELRRALGDGTIDCVATDHAPHPVEAKETEWPEAAFGMTGLETALRVVQLAMVDTGLLDWAGVADRMSVRPARIGRLTGHGVPLAAGAPANLTLYDPAAPAETVLAAGASKSRNTPFAGLELPGRVVATFLRGKPTVLGAISGAVAGLVAVTPASGFVTPMGAITLGLVAGVLCFTTSSYLKRALGYDDALDAFGVHGVGGTVGAILTGVLAVSAVGGDGKSGLIDGNPHQVIIQLYGVGCTIAYDAIVSLILLKIIDLVIGLRVDVDSEREGLDLNLHGEVVP